MCVTKLKVPFHLIFITVTLFDFTKSIYDPNDFTAKKPAMSYGIKTIKWQDNYRQQNIQVHHNYSRVNVQKPSDVSEVDQISQSSDNVETISSVILEDFDEQTTVDDFVVDADHTKIHNAHSYGVKPVESETYVEHSPLQNQNRQFKQLQNYETCQNKQDCRVLKKLKRVEIYTKCPKGESGQFIYELSCNQYLNCWKGRGFVQNCAPGTLFNPKTLECDYAEKVYCLTGPRKSMLTGVREDLTAENQATCPEGFSGIIPHYTNCSLFINCDNGVEHVMNCAPGTLFDVKSNTCTHIGKAECINQDKRSKTSVLEGSQLETSKIRDSRFHQGYTNGFHKNSPLVNENKRQDNAFYDGDSQNHTYDSSKYGSNVYQTSYSQADPLQEQIFDNGQKQTQGHRDDFGVNQNKFHTSDAQTNNNYNEQKRWVPNNGPYGQNGPIHGASNQHQNNRGYDNQDQIFGGTNYYENTRRNGRNNYNQNTAWNTQISHAQNNFQASAIAPQNDPKCDPNLTGLQPHPTDCSKFLNCANGITSIQNCGPGTVFNPDINVCDFPYNVDCKIRNSNTQQPDVYSQGQNTGYQLTTEAHYPNFYTQSQQNQDQNFGESNLNFQSTNHGSRRRNQEKTYERDTRGHRMYRTTTDIPKNENSEPDRRPPHHGNDLDLNSGGNVNKFSTPSSVNYIYEYDDDIILDPKPDLLADDLNTQKDICGSYRYTCSDNQCVSISSVCDGIQDCSNGRDEINCTLTKFSTVKDNKLAVQEDQRIWNTTATSCAKYCLESNNFTCRSFNYRKLDGACCLSDKNIGLSGALIIYNIYDYYELKDHTINCDHLYRCPNAKCISYDKVCDGQDDCGDRTDEKHCSANALGYSLKLVGSEKQNEGMIQVTAFGRTGYICDDKFGLRDANVVCKELGYSLGALEVKANSYYTKGSKQNTTFYMMDDVTCLGNETSLRDCDFNGWGVHNCMGQEVAGVVCKTQQEKCQENYWKCDTGTECIPLAFLCDGVFDCADGSDEGSQNCEAPVELRLANGTSPREGRVEIKYHGTWGSICDDDFNEDAAKVVCFQLGYHQGSATVKKEGHFGPGAGPIWLDQIYCQGNETSVQECVHWDWGEHNCEHSEDVGVICGDYDTSGSPRGAKNVEHPHRPVALAVSPDSCGYRKDNQFLLKDEVHFRVVKGSQARQGDYPWQASIRVKSKSKPAHWCGAVIISQKFVLTAAHCLVGFSKGAYFIVAGDYNVDEEEGTEQQAYIEEFYIHEEFREGQKMNNDIALVKLKGHGFSLTEDVQPICLPDEDVDYEKQLNCTISGFGSVQSGKAAYSHELRAGWIPLLPRDVCKMPHVYGSAITEGMICAGSLDEGVDACDGDSGGPLACLHEGLFTLYGMTSWGQHCGYANKPGVYVKVAHYRKWIDDKIKKHS